MKLRNKKTGEITDYNPSLIRWNGPIKDTRHYNSLAELKEDWEDYKPKEHWFISEFGKVYSVEGVFMDKERTKWLKQIGNYFETKEEAEKAVEKLKAWKRLRDKGFRFIDHIDRDSGQGMTRYEWDGYVNGEDLDLLFGGEE